MDYRFLIVCGGAGVGLLGQRRVLGSGITAELQIDVTRELVPERGDTNSLRIALDKPVGTIPLLLRDMKARIGESITQPADIRHTEFLCRHMVTGGDLWEGLAQSPAIGGGTIGHKDNLTALRNRLSVMIYKMAQNIGQENPLRVWIISSTAGGTGAGIHRSVAATLAEVVKQYWECLTLNFVRIGPATYQSINARRTRLNTFFGVAADAAFALKCSDDFPGVTTNWYYVELPDVGSGNRAKPIRAELVEMAVKTLMLDDLAGPLNTLLINDGLRMVPTRIGYWGRDFEEKVKYYEVLRRLVEKLRDLIEPSDSKYVSGRPQPAFQPGPSLPQVLRGLRSEQDLLHKIEVQGWKFPKYRGRLSEDDRIKDWKRAINELIAPFEVDNLALEAGFEIEKPEEERREGESDRMMLSVPEHTPGAYDKAWFDMIANAQRVKAWCTALLTSSGPQEGLIERLNRLARACSDAQHALNPMKGSAARARDMNEYLADFVETLVQVVRLKGLEKAADRCLQSQLAGPKELLKEAERQLEIARSAAEGMGTSPVIAADLSDELDRLRQQTWLRLLERGFQQAGSDGFRKEVLAGAVGLTEAGLLNVLGLPGNADRQRIQETLGRMGRMYSADGDEFEAQWWQAQAPSRVEQQYQFRILPEVEPKVEAQLGEGSGQIGYIYAKLGVIGLYVLAFEGVCIGNAHETVTTPAYLLRPFVPLVRDTLKNWPKEPVVGRTHGQIEVASAGVVGDPLYERALRDAGLTDEELGKIGQFYEFYNP